MTAPRRLSCAIYTRKSTEEGLDQNFNSLDAQRDACENYIASQKSEGWLLTRDRYDDGGYSGGNMDRPGLQRLLADVRAGLVDIIVVYKIDRLSRSLADFAKLVEIFDEHKVTFVSVTQAFNTTTSMGRLTLNILLSFAQFERELAGERVRDKIAASRQRGIWMGGMPPLGYDVAERKLVPNPAEAQIVREMFTRFAAVPSMAMLVRDLRARGVTSKSWTTVKGVKRKGKLIDKGYVYKIFNNPVYIGVAAYKGHHYPGEHAPIIDGSLWDTVQALLRSGTPHAKGFIGASRDEGAVIAARAPVLGTGARLHPRLDGQGPEVLPVLHQHRRHQARQGRLRRAADARRRDRDRGRRAVAADLALAGGAGPSRPRSGGPAPENQRVRGDRRPAVDRQGLGRAVPRRAGPHCPHPDRPDHGPQGRDQHCLEDRGHAPAAARDGRRVRRGSMTKPTAPIPPTEIPMTFRLRGGKTVMVLPDGSRVVARREATIDNTMVKVLARGFRWQRLLYDGTYATIEDMAAAEKINPSYISRLLRLALPVTDHRRGDP